MKNKENLILTRN